ncbi:unnamed protein product [Spirodela intermedia]|uniref:Meiosis-specific protein ASY3-like coiled-coil domain-containing protein n=1 Tax=Spirodela intermedia TaxID=51605 RepID=A0A7I8L7P1_SPIIN|nr:unnamed protein product [Spirodela intermedia]
MKLWEVRRLSGEGFMADESARKGFRQAHGWCSRASSPSESPLPLHRSKRLRSLEETGGAHQPEPSSTLPFDVSRSGETISSSPGFLNVSPDDNLGRAIGQLALVLDRFKGKIRSYTSKKGSEILSAAREGVRLRLREVENLIQADSHFETCGVHLTESSPFFFFPFFAGFSASSTEQQEKLKVVYVRFREEVDRHLVDCRGSLEDLEYASFSLSLSLSLPLLPPLLHHPPPFGHHGHPSEGHYLFDCGWGWMFTPLAPTVLEAVDLGTTCRHTAGNRCSSLSEDVGVMGMRPVGRPGLGRSDPPRAVNAPHRGEEPRGSAHRKLVLQLEEAMEAQLADAEARAARKRMNGLKGALREWLTDDGASN